MKAIDKIREQYVTEKELEELLDVETYKNS